MELIRNYCRVKTSIWNVLRSDGLRAKTMRGGAWLGGASAVEQAVRFARNMLLARLLAPGAFGAMAIVISLASLFETLTDVGVRSAVIQNPRGGQLRYINAAWWLAMGRSLCTYLLIFTMAPLVSRFYGNAELSGLLRVALLGTLCNGAMSPRSVLPQREMRFARWAVITNGGGICSVILTMVLSFLMRDVWALAIGYGCENAFRCLLSYMLCPGLPSLRWDSHAAKDLLRFSRGIFGLAFLTLIFTRVDVFVLAKLYSSAALGLYSMAIALVMTPVSFVTNVLAQLLIPALSRVQDDIERMNRILVELSSWIVLIGLPAVVSLCLCGPSVLKFAYGARYAVAAGSLSVASAVALLTVLNAVTTCALFAKGRPELHRHAGAVTAATMLVAIYPACRYLGTVGGQVAALFALTAGYLIQLFSMRGLTELRLIQYAKGFIAPTLASAGVVAAVLISRRLGLVTSPVTDVVLTIVACVIAYALSAPVLLRALEREQTLWQAETSGSAVAV